MDAVEGQSSTGIKSRVLSQLAANFAGVGQQASQLGIICFGVIQIIAGEMTMEALIAAVILSGRTLAPLAQIGLYLAEFTALEWLISKLMNL